MNTKAYAAAAPMTPHWKKQNHAPGAVADANMKRAATKKHAIDKPSATWYPPFRTSYGSSAFPYSVPVPFRDAGGGDAADTDRIPNAVTTQSSACTTSGNATNPEATLAGKPALRAMDPPRIMAEMTSAAMLSKRSAPRAEQSPTLSPTRSAITAGFRGSSSGMPASTLPTRSAPTSAAFV